MTTTAPQKSVHRHTIADVCERLGVPTKDWHLLRRWAAELLTPKALDALYAYVDVMIADRCRKPGNDLLSHLIQLQVDGEELTVDDIHRFVAALVFGAS
jgi:cytochrome P450